MPDDPPEPEGSAHSPPDFRLLYESAPVALLVLAPDAPRFTIMAASDAYLRATRTSRDIVGRGIFEVFPDDPDDASSTGAPARASFERVLATGAPDTMAVQNHSIAAPDGGFEERYWSPVNTPVLGADGQVLFIHHRVEDVTEFVRQKASGALGAALESLQTRMGEMEADVIRRGQQLQELNRELRAANERLAKTDRERARIAEERVSRGTALLQAISDTSRDVIFAKDRAGRMQFANPAALALIGKPLQQVLGRTDAQYLADEEAAGEVMANDRRIMDSGVPEEVEELVPLPDGSPRIWLSRKSPWRDAEGSVIGLLGIATDITERKRAEEALRQANDRLETMIQSITDGLLVMDRDWRYTYVSRRAGEILGMAPEALVGGCVWDLFPQARGTKFYDEYHRAVATGEPVEFVEYYPQPLDQWFECHCYPSLDGLTVYFHDVTERIRAEKGLRDSEARLRLALEAAKFGTFELDLRTGQLVWDNAKMLMWGVQEGEALRYPQVLERIPKEDAVGVARAVEESLRTGEYEAEYRVVRPDGSVHWLMARGRVEFDHGNPARMLGVELDITDRKQAEQALLAANERLREADRRKDEFLAMLSHELRNPLAPISNGVHILARAEPGSAHAQKARLVIERQAEHLTRLVDDLLDVTRIGRGKIELRCESVDLAAVARRTADDLRALLERSGLRFTVEAPADAVMVHGDATRLAQVIGNLLQNAGKFTPAGGTVRLLVQRTAQAAEVRVQDTGIGIGPELLARIFEPFVQGEQSLARSHGGLGLGLALVKGIAALHGGQVHARSEGPGRGAEFRIVLPLAANPAGTTGNTTTGDDPA